MTKWVLSYFSPTLPPTPADRWRIAVVPWLSALGCIASQTFRTAAEDAVAYRYSDYREENGRVQVQTHAADFSVQLLPDFSIKAGLVYDAISGATPTGAPPSEPGGQVPVVELKDTRRALSLAPTWVSGRFTSTPGVAYSKERDYESTGLSWNESIDFNQKNTTLNLGISRDFDRVLPNRGEWIREAKSKDNTEFLVGLNQLLDPNTYVTANLTLGYSSGFPSDPYKRVVFPEFNSVFLLPEKRPGYRFRQVFLTSITHFFTPANGSAELSYRFHHDSYEIFSNTAELSWHQKLGRHVMVSPSVRFYEQTEASFYAPVISGDPRPDQGSPIPAYYSADYRLAHLRTWTFGVTARVKVTDFCSIDLGYQRYEMLGLDGVTAPSAFPKANTFSAGLSLSF